MTLLLFLLLNSQDTAIRPYRAVLACNRGKCFVIAAKPLKPATRACGTFVMPKSKKQKRKNRRRNKKEWGW